MPRAQSSHVRPSYPGRTDRQALPSVPPPSATEQSRREETDILLLGRSRASPLPGFTPLPPPLLSCTEPSLRKALRLTAEMTHAGPSISWGNRREVVTFRQKEGSHVSTAWREGGAAPQPASPKKIISCSTHSRPGAPGQQRLLAGHGFL